MNPLAFVSGLVVLLVTASPSWATVDDVQSVFEAGNDLYAAGDYEGAARNYTQLLNSGFRSESLHYNLGNTLFRLHHLGPAILQYEKASVLAPGDSDVRANLEYVRSLTVDKFSEEKAQTTQFVLDRLLEATTLDEDAVLVSVLYLIAATLMAGRILIDRPGLRRVILWSLAAVALPLVLTTGVFVVKWYHAGSIVHAVVLSDRVEVQSGPGADSTILFTIHEGLRIRVRHQQGSWARISLKNGLTGWVQSSSFGNI